MNHSLKPWNTFGIDQSANEIVCAEDEQQLISAWQSAKRIHQPVLILGEGSNVLFLNSFSGTVIVNRIKGIDVTERADAWHLHVGAGENWHHLVQYTLQHGMPGLENLALIPGCVGSSPIQNIGAYGIELQRVCDYVDCIELATGNRVRVNSADCRFGYRDSIFKHEYQDRFAIVAVGLRLARQWQPVLTYGDLTRLDPATVTPQQVFDAVCHMRTTKLPDPKVNGNAGSFFKNPVVSAEVAEVLLSEFPNAPHYPQADGSVKLAAGWLIDQCQLKGVEIGGAAVHRQQALVLINANNATSEDVVQLAHLVREKVGEKFNVWLEPEVRFIGKSGEVNAVEIIA
ncbi:UDP-N-acetylmuramate dehydrogenase [Salmonella enterica subsp. enterica]|uniref:UDP-N-acetylenolpyruvoylglucosamine reductase n=1 Tax=Salmonella enterica subsp. enterica serovar Macclesfield str. S-1643 TaxID=1242107 RepID=A0A2C9P4Z1_SALET|nr:UDP-N-acetylmuramate dehydrogenase [Salmonella enterica]EAA5488826.1 UDP-N-acetylmuramate dehydrogenase [Salmonella enterica subsp. enterica serovar Kouka]EBV2195237.1 UDP-N-acetylmuramate dehydrogenase [Salmonella enterica subsp. enterica serovar Afula]ECH9430651.1 UDP-N-acetylmuramate dehydrogenase [Salmonella enterica subsp. enterica]ASG18613.1 UDP-N-acetylenolpyruvoylglucosamine reductase [Salmonella enterica subsp. enterica serovar Macclesfield str. S-1643]EAC1133982.1 UDP-N-acetylmura